MPENFPIIDLDGYERLRTLEQRLGRSPVEFALQLVAWGGLAVAAVRGVLIFAIPERFPNESAVVTVAVALFVSGIAAGLDRACMFYRLARLPCPQCGRLLSRHIADVPVEERGRWNEPRRVPLGGRVYSRSPDSEDKRPWVRVMKEVRACVPCRVYIEYAQSHFHTCTADELRQLELQQSSTTPASRA
jgi:hypothetical protein